MRATVEFPDLASDALTEASPPPRRPREGTESRPRPVVLPLDGSALSERARPFAIAVASERKAPLALLAVVDPYQASALGLASAAGAVLYDVDVPDAILDVKRYLEAQVAACERAVPGLAVTAYVQVGDAAREILEATAQLRGQLVVMTTHGRGGIDRWIRGSVAERIVSEGTVPVMLVRPWDHAVRPVTPEAPGRRVLVPLDGTPLAEEAIDEAIRLAGPGEVLLVRDVVPVRDDWSFNPGVQLALNAQAEAYLEVVAARVRAARGRARTAILTRPDVTEAICGLVTLESIDVIALATHGRGTIGRWLHGSVSDELARRAPVPVVLVHGTGERVPVA